MGLLIGGAVFPAAFSIIWKKQTCLGAISGCVSGLAAGLIAWLTTAYRYYGAIPSPLPAPNTPHLRAIWLLS